MPKNNVGSLLIQQPIEFWAEIETRLKCASQEKSGLQEVYVVFTSKVTRQTQQALYFMSEPDFYISVESHRVWFRYLPPRLKQYIRYYLLVTVVAG